MKTRRTTAEATKASRRRQQIAAVNRKEASKVKTSSRTQVLPKVKRNASKSKRAAAVSKKTRSGLRSSGPVSAGTKKREWTPTTDKEQQQQKNKSAVYSPIKTRGLYKKEARGTEHCRICKTDADGFMACSVCQTKYHLECLGYTPESVQLVYDRRFYTWLCPACTYCCKCNEIICDPENVQCFACDRAFHGTCRPTSGAWTNPKDPLSQWSCPECKHLLEVEKSEQPESVSSSANSSWGSESSRSRNSNKRDNGQAYVWKAKLQAERDAVNNQLKDLCREYLEDKERKEKEEMKRQYERENFKPKKKMKISVKNTKKIKRSDTEYEPAKNIRIIDGVKFSIKKPNGSEQMSEAEKQRTMREKSSAFDYSLYMAAKREFLATQPSEDMNADEEIPPRPQWIQFGSKRLLAMYSSPYPKRIAQSPNVCVCQFCLTAMEDSTMYEMHMAQCEWQHPPGNEIYREDGLSFWEIDGADEIAYCRRLCLLSKLFLFSKTLHHEVETFLFYILTEHTPEGCVLLGYFSKEKNPSKNNNLSCLLTLPSSQRTGYGKMLIDLSYKLSLRERKIGGPEHPLSDMGLITYRSYWKAVIITYIRKRRPTGTISIKEMSNETGIHTTDIIGTMLESRMLKYRDGNYFINKRKAFTAPLHTFRRRVVHDDKLIWEPEFDVEDAHKMGTYVD